MALRFLSSHSPVFFPGSAELRKMEQVTFSISWRNPSSAYSTIHLKLESRVFSSQHSCTNYQHRSSLSRKYPGKRKPCTHLLFLSFALFLCLLLWTKKNQIKKMMHTHTFTTCMHIVSFLKKRQKKNYGGSLIAKNFLFFFYFKKVITISNISSRNQIFFLVCTTTKKYIYKSMPVKIAGKSKCHQKRLRDIFFYWCSIPFLELVSFLLHTQNISFFSCLHFSYILCTHMV